MDKKPNKTIERAKAIISKRLDKISEEYEDAYGNWRDTGYDRYQKKMDRLEEEKDELETFLKPQQAINAAYRETARKQKELDDLNFLLKKIKNSVFYLCQAFPDCSETRSLQRLMDDIR